MATKAEIRQRVGEELSLVPIGQSLESQDVTRIDSTFDEVYERLKEKGLATWASSSEVPTKLVPYFTLMMLEKLVSTYSVPESRFARIKADAGLDGTTAMARLAELAIPEYDPTEGAVDF